MGERGKGKAGGRERKEGRTEGGGCEIGLGSIMVVRKRCSAPPNKAEQVDSGRTRRNILTPAGVKTFRPAPPNKAEQCDVCAYVRACMFVGGRACVGARARACVRVCVRACACACACVRAS